MNEPSTNLAEAPVPSGANRAPVLIRTKDVTKVFRNGEMETHALRGITCEIRRGEFITVMGPSGSGKSTFFNVIGALSTPTAGRVLVDEVDVAQLSRDELAYIRCKKIGYIFQTYNLVSGLSALENVMISMLFAGTLEDEARTKATRLLDQVGLAGRWSHTPKELSGGQQQRVAIARSLANSPRILLCDEPTANLDHKTGQEIIDLLVALNRDQGVTIICATHDYRMLDKSDRIFWIRDGCIAKIQHRADVKIQLASMEEK